MQMNEAEKPIAKPEPFDWETMIDSPESARTQFKHMCADFEDLGFRIDTKTKMLEVGSGKGVFTRYLVDFGCDVVAVDINPRGDTSIPVARISVEYLPFDETDPLQRFDLVIGFGFIDPKVYIQNIGNIFSELERVLEDKGYIYLMPLHNISKEELELSLPFSLKVVVFDYYHVIIQKITSM